MQIRTELTFPKELKEEAIICCLCKEYDIVLNIVEASFSTDTGWAILVFKSNEEELLKSCYRNSLRIAAQNNVVDISCDVLIFVFLSFS